MMLDAVDKPTLRRRASSDPGWKKNKECGFLGKEINSEMSLFLLHLGIKFILQNSSTSISFLKFFTTPSVYVMVALSAPVQLPLSIQQVFIEHLFEAQSLVLRDTGLEKVT